jgi:hypothetical protein
LSFRAGRTLEPKSPFRTPKICYSEILYNIEVQWFKGFKAW